MSFGKPLAESSGASSRNTPRNRWIRHFRRNPSRRRHLVCFPHAGGAASFFHAWAGEVPAGIDLSAIQYPGREDRSAEAFIDTVDELARQAAEVVLPLCTPETILFGHSMGAIVAYEVAARIRRAGAPLARIVVSAHAPPHRSRARRPPVSEDEILAELRLSSGRSELPFDRETFVENFLPSLRNDYRLICAYERDSPPPLDVPILAAAGRSDPKVTPQQMRDWSDLAPGQGFSATVFEGGHFYLQDQAGAVVTLATA